MRDPRFDVSSHSPRPRSRGWRRLAALFTVIVTAAALVLPLAAASATGRSTAPAGSQAPAADAPCTRTVGALTAAAVHLARDLAGANGVVCFPAGTIGGFLVANISGQTWRLNSATVLTGIVNITAPRVTLSGGSIARPAADRWEASVQIRADDVTVTAIAFRGGGTGVNVYGKDRARIISNSFRYQSGSAISIWSEGVGADRTLVWGNLIILTHTHQTSPITSRGNESSGRGGVQNFGSIIRHNTINSGQGETGWFGIELKQSKGSIVENNLIQGGRVLMSIPETDNALIRYNVFDLRGKPNWAIEIGNTRDTTVDRNTFIGDGSGSADYGMALNTSPLRVYARFNRATSIRTFIGIAGDGHRVNDNCLNSVQFIHEWMNNGGPDIVFARNGPCP